MRRLLPLVALLALTGCDAGNRADPGSDNTLHSPTLVISTPYEGQQVVPTAADGTVQVLFDVQAANFGRTAGSKVRYRLQREGLDADAKPTLLPKDPPWVVVAEPQHAVSLGQLAPVTSQDAAFPYVLTAEVIDKDGKPWTREEEGKGTVNARSRVVRKFTVHKSWTDKP